MIKTKETGLDLDIKKTSLGTVRNGWKIKKVSLKKSDDYDVVRLIGKDIRALLDIGKQSDCFLAKNQPPWSILVAEPIYLKTACHREKAIQSAGYNTFLLKSEDVYLDFLTDSGTSAMSDNQWDGMEQADEAYAGSWNFDSLQKAVQEIMGYSYTAPTHQGRAAEHLLCKILVKPGQRVLNNMYFTTRRAHQELAGGVWRDFAIKEAYEPENGHLFKGNWDLNKLEDFLKKTPSRHISHLSCEAALNMAGGQPFSMANLKGLRFLSQKFRVPLWLDATRIICNAFLIKERESDYQDKTVKEIVREICFLSDGCTMSGKKDALVNIGGFVATFDREIYKKVKELSVIYEGLHTYGGLAGRDMEAMARGLREFAEEKEVGFYIRQVCNFGERLEKAGIPIVKPIGAHAVFLDVKRFLPHLKQEEFPAQSLTAELYAQSGIRSMERGIVSGQHNKEEYRGLELVRLTIPRRVCAERHFDYAVEKIADLYDKRKSITGLTMTYAPKELRFFNAIFAKKN